MSKGNTCSNAASSVAGIARAIYERTFRIVVDKCNQTLIDPTMKKVTYIGVLDIAGFEIFDYNGFEQICINYVNEKVHMMTVFMIIVSKSAFPASTVLQSAHVHLGARRICQRRP